MEKIIFFIVLRLDCLTKLIIKKTQKIKLNLNSVWVSEEAILLCCCFFIAACWGKVQGNYEHFRSLTGSIQDGIIYKE